MDGEELSQWDAQGPSTNEEKIFVSVRLRPLNEREIARNDESDWECINDNTILFKKNLPERSLFPTAYTFDRVFGCDSSTKQVYDEGAKKVALSVVNGINSSIFAYGQTSSGKTYTMRGITECTVADIYEYIDTHSDREFVLKFSAMEIYNESVRDLLSSDTTPLRLLDDPERGTVVEKLTEVTLRNWSHLRELFSVCEAERQIGETSLNEMSSRSHQILRLTVESSACEFLGAENSSTLAATVNFVDLAGSERASQTLSAGTRLKEGCHINRSLLTLGTVIRKLSKGRNGHIPYRDSKLTRILQNYLGGNARTAIICTMSPAHSHVEQSRNTLLFAVCAKEVNTNAQVNVVMSEKALVKQLQRELARLENELRSSVSNSATSDSESLLKEKELLIEKMDKEIRELTQQRDLAQSRVEDLLRSTRHNQFSSPWIEGHEPHLLENSEDHFLSDSTSPRIFMNKYFGPDPSQGWEKISHNTDIDSEDNCKEVRCIETESSIDKNTKSEAQSSPEREDKGVGHSLKEETYEALRKKIQDMRTTIDYLVSPYPVEPSPCSSDTDISDSRSINLARSRSCRAIITTEKSEQNESTPPNGYGRDFFGRPEGYQVKISELKPDPNSENLSRKDSEASVISVSMEEEKELNVKTSSEGEGEGEGESEGDVDSLHSSVSEVNEVVKPESEMQYDEMVQEAVQNINELGKIVANEDGLDKENGWPLEFEKQRREIIELWNACNVSLVHRTYFFLLFKGDPSDAVYIEVELRQLSFLKKALSHGTKTGKYDQILPPTSSTKALIREREMLTRQMLKKFSAKERASLYQKWGIKLDTKQRRLQVARRLWTDTKNMDHINESAALVSKLVGFAEPGQAPKEMFGLSLFPQPVNFRSFSWKQSMSSLK